MKIGNKFYTVLAGFAFFAHMAAAQETTTNIFGGADSSSATEIKAEGSNLDVVLNPNADAPAGSAFFFGNGNTIGSLKTTGTPSSWNIGDGNTVIDINRADSGEYEAFVNTGSMTLTGNSQIEFVNLAGNSAVAKVDLGEFTFAGSDNLGDYGLHFKTNAVVEGTDFTAKTNGASPLPPAIWVTNNSNVVYNVKSSTFKTNTEMTVDKGSTLTVNGVLYMTAYGSLLNVNGTFNYNSTNLYLNQVAITGTLNSKSSVSLTGKGSQISGSGVMNSEGVLELNNGSDFKILDNAKVNLTKTNATVNLKDKSELTIAAKNAIGNNGKLVSLAIRAEALSAANATLNVLADNKFDKLYFNRSSNTTLTITVADGAHLYFNGLDLSSYTAGKITLNIKDFVEQSIFFKDITGWEDITTVSLSDTAGNTYTKDDLYLVEGNYIDGTNGYWLSTSAIPEPSTWAAIFGALALALAVYRKRR